MLRSKRDFIRAVAETSGMTQEKTQQMVEAALAEIQSQLYENGICQLIGFGTFRLRQRKPRRVPDKLSLKPHTVPGHFYVTFTPGRDTKNMAFLKYLESEVKRQ